MWSFFVVQRNLTPLPNIYQWTRSWYAASNEFSDVIASSLAYDQEARSSEVRREIKLDYAKAPVLLLSLTLRTECHVCRLTVFSSSLSNYALVHFITPSYMFLFYPECFLHCTYSQVPKDTSKGSLCHPWEGGIFHSWKMSFADDCLS